MARRKLLFLSPVWPMTTGNGLAMRAGAVLEALAADYDVHLLVIPIFSTPRFDSRQVVKRWCVAAHEVTLHGQDALYTLTTRAPRGESRQTALLDYPRPALYRFATARNLRAAAEPFRNVAFDAVHVFRTCLAPFVDPFLRQRRLPSLRLDMDDLESHTRTRFADLHTINGRHELAALERAEGEKYRVVEQEALRRFATVYVGAARDRATLLQRHDAARVFVLPNTVRLPRVSASARAGRYASREPSDPLRILFLGTLGYFPNEDAACFFATEVLPRIAARSSRQPHLTIAGSGQSTRLRALSTDSSIDVLGAVRRVGPLYRRSDQVVVPLRAGGGTRIKVLEAFAHRRPVVSTSIGIEGLDVQDGRHCRIADEPALLAQACVELGMSPGAASAMVEVAFEYVLRNHTPTRLLDILRETVA